MIFEKWFRILNIRITFKLKNHQFFKVMSQLVWHNLKFFKIVLWETTHKLLCWQALFFHKATGAVKIEFIVETLTSWTTVTPLSQIDWKMGSYLDGENIVRNTERRGMWEREGFACYSFKTNFILIIYTCYHIWIFLQFCNIFYLRI